MSSEKKIIELEAKHGEKMIEIKIRFWTNEIAGPDKVKVKHAWSAGVVRIEKNKSHEIKPSKPMPFHSLLDVGSVIEETLIKHGITLHPSKKMKKYFDTEC